MNESSRIVLLDNGSLRPESTLSLRALASGLADLLGTRVDAVSLLHSSKVPSEKLGGIPAATWRRYLKQESAMGIDRFAVLPLFFGPSLAIVDYLPKATEEVACSVGPIDLKVARCLVDPGDRMDDGVARLLAELVEEQRSTAAPSDAAPKVLLVDHGSPVPEVAACRNLVAEQMAVLLGAKVAWVIPCSMERREGDAYAFNDPLLAAALAALDPEDEAILCPMFFSPGRHAGPGGDIAQIVSESAWAQAGRRLPVCRLVGESPLLLELLEQRWRALASTLPNGWL